VTPLPSETDNAISVAMDEGVLEVQKPSAVDATGGEKSKAPSLSVARNETGSDDVSSKAYNTTRSSNETQAV